MKISYNWLQNFFASPLPDAQGVSDALTFHVFEIDGIEEHGADRVLDVKVTPNRGHDCLSHRGIAKELSAILKMPMNAAVDPFAKTPDLSKATDTVRVSIEEPTLCMRYIAGHIKNVKVGPSPEWLKASLEAIGQRSINNIVDATNLVMFNTGQPLHAFDAGQLTHKDGRYAISVRKAREGETMLALDDKEYKLNANNLVISDAYADIAVGIAGVKGGKPAGVSESTNEIIIESANFDGVSVRKTASALKLRTDASSRFEQVITPELAAYGMQQAVDLILALAGGEVVGFADVYPRPFVQNTVSVSLEKINRVLGITLTEADVDDAFTRLRFSYVKAGTIFTVTPPFERLDLVIPEDLVEEVGRIVGYDLVKEAQLPALATPPAINKNFAKIEYARAHMAEHGYSEVYTSVFAEKGERQVLNKVGGERPFMRANLTDGLKDALERNVRNKDLLGINGKVKLIEIGTVWSKTGEEIRCATAEEKGEIKEFSMDELPEAPDTFDFPRSALERYQIFSKYPFIVRDIAMWVPTGTEPDAVRQTLSQSAGPLMVHVRLFDTFAKGERTSLAFRLVFQSMEKTLTDEEVNAVMAGVTDALKAKGYEIR